MKPIPPLRLCLALCASSPGWMVAAEPTTHVLYLGADVSIDWHGRLRRVVDVKGSAFVIDDEGRRVVVPEEAGNLRVKLDAVLKLSPLSATVERLKGERAFTAESNPTRDMAIGVNQAQDAQTVTDIALGQANAIERQATAGRADGTPAPALARDVAVAKEQFDAALNAQAMMSPAPNDHVTRGVDLAGREPYDALALSFDLASSSPLSRPYIVVVARYLDQPGSPGPERLAVFAQAIPKVGASPRRIRFLRGGFPPGYQLQRYEVHLYDDGREVATSMAPKRVELTSGEAFQYALIERLSAPAGTAAIPVPAREFWPLDLLARLIPENRNRILYVQVDKQGRATGAFHDEAGRLRITDADITALLPELRFLPAVEGGKAVPGICQVTLGEIPLQERK